MVVVRYQIPQAQAIANPGGTFLATGGRTSHSPTRTYHLFTHPGTFTVSSPLSDVEVLVVGAGGGGGIESGGGGGAGAVVEVTSYTVSSPQSVTVGQGGCSTSTNSPGHNQSSSNTGKGNAGSNSNFGPITALGGQGGGSGWNSIQTPVSPFGGCGGGSHDNVGTNDPAPAQPGQNAGIPNLDQYSNPGGPNAGPGINNGNGGGGAGGPAGDTMVGGIGRQVPTNFRPSPSTYLNAGTTVQVLVGDILLEVVVPVREVEMEMLIPVDHMVVAEEDLVPVALLHPHLELSSLVEVVVELTHHIGMEEKVDLEL